MLVVGWCKKSGIECRKLGVGARLALTPKRDSLLCEVHGPTFLGGRQSHSLLKGSS